MSLFTPSETEVTLTSVDGCEWSRKTRSPAEREEKIFSFACIAQWEETLNTSQVIESGSQGSYQEQITNKNKTKQKTNKNNNMLHAHTGRGWLINGVHALLVTLPARYYPWRSCIRESHLSVCWLRLFQSSSKTLERQSKTEGSLDLCLQLWTKPMTAPAG